jgi:hypothetical protein
VVQTSLVDGEPEMPLVQHDVNGFFHRGVLGDPHHVGAGGHDVADLYPAQTQDIPHHVPLVLPQDSFPASQLGQDLDLRPTHSQAVLPPGLDEAVEPG